MSFQPVDWLTQLADAGPKSAEDPLQVWFATAAAGADLPNPSLRSWLNALKKDGARPQLLQLASRIYAGMENHSETASNDARHHMAKGTAAFSVIVARQFCGVIAQRMLQAPPMTESEIDALSLAHMAGQSQEWALAEDWEPAATAGAKQLAASAEGARARRKATAPRAQLLEELNALRQRAPSLSLSRAQAIIAEKYGISRPTLIRRMNGPQ